MSDWLESIPLFWGKVIATIFFLAVMIWAWFIPRAYIFENAPNHQRWRDLRIWATLLLCVQIVLYLIF